MSPMNLFYTRFFLSLIFFASLFIEHIKAQNLMGPKLECFVLHAPEKRLENKVKIAILDFNTTINEKSSGVQNNLAAFMTTLLLKDDLGISSIKKVLGSKEGKTYTQGVNTHIFKVIEREEINKVITEQKLSISGMIDEDQSVEIGKMLGLDAIIFGNISFLVDDKESALKGPGKKAIPNYNIKRTVTAEAVMKIVDVATGEIIGAKTVVEEIDDKVKTSGKEGERPKLFKEQRYNELRKKLKSPSELTEELFREKISYALVSYFNPTFQYVKYNFEVINNKDYKDNAKYAVKYLKNGDLLNAYKIYKAIYDEDSYNAKVSFNLGILHEVVGDFEKAHYYFKFASDAYPDNKLYTEALQRSEKGLLLVEDFEKQGVKIVKNSFEEGDNTALLKRVTIRGSRKSRANIYEKPELTSKKIAKIPGGITLKVYKEEEFWYLVGLNSGEKGYIKKEDVKE